MAKNLVIVESPAKAKTISKFLGKDYTVMASMGHVRDLPKSKMGVDTENDFEPTYMVPQDKKKIMKALKEKVKDDTVIWLATDEDREGEAIGWHILQALGVEEDERTKRIVFHEITKPAILEAVKHPRKIHSELVSAQQARRVLDRIVGYELSPLLWKKVRYGLSAGRVQSVAVRLIVEREREIKAFKPEEYWTLKSLFKTPKPFDALLVKIHGKKALIKNKGMMDAVLKDIDDGLWFVRNVEEKEVKRNPAPPFITSTLQQEAARKLGFSVKKTMLLAQQLYEGVEMKGEQSGLITYMRTDSVNLARTAAEAAREIITKKFGPDFALESPRFYKSKSRAQEAHEAIRPSDLALTPQDAAPFLHKDQARLYELIWKRTVACQMKEAVLNQIGADIIIKDRKDKKELPYVFRATGQSVKFPGFMEVYMEGRDEGENGDDDGGNGDFGSGNGDFGSGNGDFGSGSSVGIGGGSGVGIGGGSGVGIGGGSSAGNAGFGEKFLPPLQAGASLDLDKLLPEQHFTKPPPRYTEASLVKKLESESIGRPSTYAPTISTVQNRGYIEKEGKQLKPTDVGELVNDLLVSHFPDIVDYKFTAAMEDDLDKIAEGKKEWVPMIREFYKPFHSLVDEKQKVLKKSEITQEASDEVCEKCGKPMIVRLGRYGKFLSCSDYPKCKNAKPLKKDGGKYGAGSGAGTADSEQQSSQAELEELQKKFSHRRCEKCKKPMQVKNGRFGYFLGCTDYPACKSIQSIIRFTGVKCSNCELGQLVERRVRRTGKVFYGCNKFPKCKTATWDKPVGNCEKCQGIVVEYIKDRRSGGGGDTEKRCLTCNPIPKGKK